MHEETPIRQEPGARKRRWFSSDEFDLILWLNEDESFSGFELCYGKKTREHSIVWREQGGFSHMAVDDGEGRGGRYKQTPILVADGSFDARRVYDALAEESRELPSSISEYVLSTLRKHPDFKG